MLKKNNSSDASKKSALADISKQFQGLDTAQPATWPALPRYALFVLVAILVAILGWVLLLSSVRDDLISAQDREGQLKSTYQDKYAQAVNLEALQEQRLQVQRYVTQLEKQLPNKAEMDALLSDINQAGLGRGLQFESFKPGAVVNNQYYAELPIDVKVTGKYHDIGLFAADIAGLSRIVTLNNIQITPEKNGTLSLVTTAKTFRYLDSEEADAQAKAK